MIIHVNQHLYILLIYLNCSCYGVQMINYILYIISIVSAVIVGLLIKLPLLPERPMRQSWTISVVFPTIVIAVGLFAIFDYFKIYNNIYTAIIIGIFAAIFSRFLLEKMVPIPHLEESN